METRVFLWTDNQDKSENEYLVIRNEFQNLHILGYYPRPGVSTVDVANVPVNMMMTRELN